MTEDRLPRQIVYTSLLEKKDQKYDDLTKYKKKESN